MQYFCLKPEITLKELECDSDLSEDHWHGRGLAFQTSHFACGIELLSALSAEEMIELM